MIEIAGLAKSFGPRHALASIDLTVSRGEFVVWRAPAVPGTTLLRIRPYTAAPYVR